MASRRQIQTAKRNITKGQSGDAAEAHDREPSTRDP